MQPRDAAVLRFDAGAESPRAYVVAAAPGAARNDAGRTYRVGLSRAFQRLGVSAYVVDPASLARLAAEGRVGRDDLVVSSVFDLMTFPRPLRRAMHDTRLLAWVSQWFPDQRAFCRRHDLPDIGVDERTARATAECAPRAVFTSNTPSCFEFYENWIVEHGRLLSFPLAYDDVFYEATAGRGSVDDGDLGRRVVYVGGWWPYKGRSLRRYLMPFADRLAVYGYSQWPFGSYRGTLGLEDEADVLRAAAVVPGVNEPHAEVMGGDVCERVYKVAGLGGLCVADLCFGYRDLFADDELLMPRTYAEYIETVAAVLSGELDTARYRAAGRSAVFDRHLYEHRAVGMLEAAGLALPGRSGV